MLLRRRDAWTPAEQDATPEHYFLTRRTLIAAFAAALAACREPRDEEVRSSIAQRRISATRDARFAAERSVTDELVAARYNNFYEFSAAKDDVWRLAQSLDTRGWTVEVTGLVRKPRTFDLDDLRRFELAERIYRFRCVEAWAMVIPWIGFPLSRLLASVEPLSSARYVRFETFNRPLEASRQQSERAAPWPYVEGLRLDEAMHDLTLLVTGVYGHELPKQHGAPVRLVVPWKYGFKSAKSLVRIELTSEQPRTFWNSEAPAEYSFEANVDPTTPHPRWSQATERLIGTWKVNRTRLFNGYDVSSLYRA